MIDSENVKFIEINGKWLWKRYDEQGSVIFKSPEFDTEQLAREDYKENGGGAQTAPLEPNAETSVSQPVDAGNAAPEGELSAGTASPEGSQSSTDQTV